jgi:hypothetical protein
VATVSTRYLDLARKSKRELADVFAAGTAPDVPALIGFEFRGFNQPATTALLGIRKFIKVFYLDQAGRSVGCNTPVVQNGLDSEWIARPHPDRPKRYAFYSVDPADPDASDQRRQGAVMLDYSRGANPQFHPARILRDYLVRVDPGSDDLLLGRAFFVIGGRPMADTFFLIERYRPLADTDPLIGSADT